MSGVTICSYNLGVEGPEPIFSLFERVYGDSIAIRNRWHWEWQQHPEASRIKFFVAESGQKLVGMTVRMPIQLDVSGQIVDATFATNSMVDPDHRGQGIIHRLYKKANVKGEIQLSKGTAEVMFRQLLKMGYTRIQPDTYQVCLLFPWLWLKQKAGFTAEIKVCSKTAVVKDYPDYRSIDSFPDEVDSLTMSGLISPVKTAAWLNWRYVDIPHRQYQFAIREIDGRIVSWCVIRTQGRTAYLVDLRYSDTQQDEPAYSIGYAKRAAKACGTIKMMAWGSAAEFRRCLLRMGFLSRKETPHFSYKAFTVTPALSRDWQFIQGDGDSDYL